MGRREIKIISYAGMIALLASMIVGLLGYSNNTREIDNIKNKLLEKHVENNIELTMRYIQQTYGELSQGDQTLLDRDGESIEGRFGVVDSVLEDLGDKSTIFVKINDDFKRISTNIMFDETERAMGSFLGKDHNAYQDVINGELYIGEAKILDEDYYTAYQPIKDKNNNVIGLLFVGMPTKTLDETVEIHDKEMDLINIFILILRAISLASLIALASISARQTKDDDFQPGN